MSKFATRLNRASARLLNTGHQHIPVPFEIHCSCGNRLSGLRRNTAQLSSCSSCKRSFYVLPVNTYPTTGRVPSHVSDKGLAGRSVAALRELLGISTVAAVTPISRRPASQTSPAKIATVDTAPESAINTPERSGQSDNTTKDEQNQAPLARQKSESARLQRPAVPLMQRIRRVFSPVRIIAFSTILLLGTTIWWMIRERQHEAAIRNWRTCMDEVLIALEEEDPARLREFLPLAVNAADTLQRDDEEAALVRSLHQQTRALAQISSYDLIDQLESLGTEDPAVLQQKASLLRKQWFLFQSPLAAGSDSKSVVLRLPLQFGTEPVRLSVRSDMLRAYLQQVKTPQALFMAPISSIDIDPGPPTRAAVALDGDQLVLLTLDFLAADAGFDPNADAELKQLLLQQADFVGVRTTMPTQDAETAASAAAEATGETSR